MQPLMPSKEALRYLLIDKLAQNSPGQKTVVNGLEKPSAVLCLIGHNEAIGPHLILTKRSLEVSQPGDLSFPGGGPHPISDALLAKLLNLPQMPLARWPHRKKMAQEAPSRYQTMITSLATSLRESFEEIRLCPFNVDFLGTMPPQSLVMFKRTIFPMVGWLKRPTRFKSNGEVAAIMTIPLADFFDPDNYANYRVNYSPSLAARINQTHKEFPCFVFQHNQEQEILWGVTFRIVMTLLSQVFDYQMPSLVGRPVFNGRIGKSYYRG